MRKTKKTASTSRSVDRTVQIVEALARMPQGAGVTDLQRSTGFPVSSIYTVVTALTERGWLTKDATSLKYRVSSKLFSIGSSAVSRMIPFQAFDLVAKKMVEECQEAIHLGVLEGRELLIVAREEGHCPIQLVRKVGERLPAYATSQGKVLLAALEPEQINGLFDDGSLPALTSSTITSLKDLKQELALIRQQGYACNLAESTAGVYGTAAPIFDVNGHVVAALNISAMLDRTPPGKQRELISLVKRGASLLSSDRFQQGQTTILP